MAGSGCQLPQWRIFQAKVDPKLAEKPAAQIEAERRGAQYIRDNSAAPKPDPIAQVAEIHAVAVPLSASLGEPKHAADPAANPQAVIDQLRAGLLAEQKRADAWRDFARKHAGREIEGTGVNLAGPGALLGVAGVVALCIFVPGFLTFLLFIIRRLRGTVQQIAQGVEEFRIEHPDQAAELKEYLSSAMDRTAKAIVKREKTYLDQSNLTELLARQAATTANGAAQPNAAPA